jgi:hypothetical protein
MVGETPTMGEEKKKSIFIRVICVLFFIAAGVSPTAMKKLTDRKNESKFFNELCQLTVESF